MNGSIHWKLHYLEPVAEVEVGGVHSRDRFGVVAFDLNTQVFKLINAVCFGITLTITI